MAASVPVPMAMPISAVASAAESLTPSPTMATFLPSACRRLTTSAFSMGLTPAMTSPAAIPTCEATRAATSALSPVSNTGVMPMALSSSMARRLEGFTVSATSISPRRSPPQLTAAVVFWPSIASIETSWPSTTPLTPTPGSLRKLMTGDRASRADAAAATMALATGCSEADSTEAAMRRISSASATPEPMLRRTSTTLMTPVVTVPVLSSTTVSMSLTFSSTSGPLISTPSCAPRPVPTRMAVGVANPSAHGQAMINTATAAVNAEASGLPRAAQATNVNAEIPSTTGTNTDDTRSASRCTCALPVCASDTNRAIRASCVSAPTLLARTTIRPWVFT
ncbi:Uncharacterised protein [Mycobacteroides abscessus subsp. abscessus]|nr:Uncharacterised protein [Mycobacteroides abscessus subsp. abscessus]